MYHQKKTIVNYHPHSGWLSFPAKREKRGHDSASKFQFYPGAKHRVFFKTINFIISVGVMLAVLSIFPFTAAAMPGPYSWLFESLKKRLVADGFDEQRIDQIYTAPNIEFAGETVSNYFTYKEATLNYKQFTSQKSITNARRYLKTYQNELTHAENTFGVDKTVITAIILVETRFGTYTGNNNILNTLSTMASLKNHANRDVLWREYLNSYKLSRKKYDKKALRKANWAYRELKAFLSYTAREDMNPSGIYGSFAGAMGIAQFLPSNILTLGKDGNKDGTIDLYTHADAIASIANYLKHYGWKPGIDRKNAFTIIYRYNHSKYYVNTVLKISDLLKG